jgi:hypothetical protein
MCNPRTVAAGVTRGRQKLATTKVNTSGLSNAEIFEEESVFIKDSPNTSGEGQSRSQENSARRDLSQCSKGKTIQN